jgi:hypothetical protein
MKRWNESLWLVTKEEFDNLPRNLILTNILNENRCVGDVGRGDTRFDVLSYGLTEESATAQGFREEFLLMVLNS